MFACLFVCLLACLQPGEFDAAIVLQRLYAQLRDADGTELPALLALHDDRILLEYAHPSTSAPGLGLPLPHLHRD